MGYHAHDKRQVSSTVASCSLFWLLHGTGSAVSQMKLSWLAAPGGDAGHGAQGSDMARAA